MLNLNVPSDNHERLGLFFFSSRRRHTRLQGDWSSDVCSSDLVKLKHNANSALIDGKSIVLIDDSIVRGTTSVKLVQMMRDAGAREVHMRIASPPTRHCCFYGVDTPERAKLLAAQMNRSEEHTS